jgi:DNA-binding NtrC family response regulator
MTLDGKILIVDDHIDLAENIAEVLETAGYQTVVADSAEAALVRLETGDVAAVITDYRLPGCNGAELIVEMRRRGLTIPALVMSAFTDERTMEHAQSAGALEFMAKPIDLKHLFQVMKAVDSGESVVLIVDDNRELASNLGEMLADQGFRPVITGSVAEALAARPRPRAAIVDFKLPDGTGVDVAERLQAQDPGIGLLFVSGHAEDLERSLSGRLSQVQRLEKPLAIERLLEWVNRTMGQGGRAAHPRR